MTAVGAGLAAVADGVGAGHKARIKKMDKPSVEKRYAVARIRQVGAMLFVYAIFYVCRLAFSASKKGMIEQGAYTPTEIGKAFGLDGRDLNSFLADQKIIRWARGQWQLTQKYLHRELTANRYSYVHGRDGRRKLVSRLVWTEKGREFIMDLINDNVKI